MALPFNKSVSHSMPGFGSPSFYGSGAQVAAAVATTNVTIPGAAKAGPTGFSVTAGTPGTLTAVFALVAIYADGSISAPVYYTLPTANTATSTYIFTWTAATDGVAGTTKYSSFYLGTGAAPGAIMGYPMMAAQLVGASPYALSTAVLPSTGLVAFTGGPSAAFNAAGDPAPSSGKIRIRTSSVGSTGTTTVLFTVTDGTTTLQVGAIPTTAAGVAIDQVIDFVTDLAITSVTAAVTMAVAAQTAVVELETSLV